MLPAGLKLSNHLPVAGSGLLHCSGLPPHSPGSRSRGNLELAKDQTQKDYKMLSQQEAKKPESRALKAPEKQLKTQALYLEGLYWLLSTLKRSPRQERKGPPCPNTKRHKSEGQALTPALGEGVTA